MTGWLQTITIVIALIGCLTGFMTWQMHWLARILDARFAAVDARFGAVETRFDAFETRFDAFETRLDAFEARFDAKIDALEEKTDLKFDTVIVRLDHLEGDMTIIKNRLIGQATG